MHRIGALEARADMHAHLVADHVEKDEKSHADHEERLRPLEQMRAQLLILAALGAAVGAALVNYLFQR